MPKDYTFDPETGEFVATADFDSKNPNSGKNDVGQMTYTGPDSGTILGGNGLQPPNTFGIDPSPIGQVVRVNPDGTVVVDVTMVVEDGMDSGEYEVRVTK